MSMHHGSQIGLIDLINYNMYLISKFTVGGIMHKFSLIVCAAMSLAACTTSSGVSPQMAGAQKLYNQKMDECEARKHKRAVDKVRCINGAEQVLLPVAGGTLIYSVIRWQNGSKSHSGLMPGR